MEELRRAAAHERREDSDLRASTYSAENRLTANRFYTPDNRDIETWVSENFKDHNNEVVLLKMYIPDSDRIECLKALNRMNINHSTLFPDLFGAAKYVNRRLEVENY